MKKLFNWFNKELKKEQKFQADIEKARLEMERQKELEIEEQKFQRDILACNLYLYYDKDTYKYIGLTTPYGGLIIEATGTFGIIGGA